MKKYLWISVTVFSVLILGNCKNDPSTNSSKSMTELMKDPVFQEGFAIVDQNCIACHSADASMDNRVAPPLEAIKRHYITKKTTQTEFVNDMVDFLSNPQIVNSKMPNAVKKFGIMPTLSLPKEQYEAVAKYLFNAEVEKPDWFEEHYSEEKAAFLKYSDEGSLDVMKKGQNIATATKTVLGKNLLGAINKMGTEGALAFCNEKAIPLTDSMSLTLNAKIKRVSDKNRNPDNAANEDELSYISLAKKEIAVSGQASPKMTETGNGFLGYYPIMTNDMCLQCHGKVGETLKEPTFTRIVELYPKDLATGYASDELRGIWVVEMSK
jgi:cytochrome c553